MDLHQLVAAEVAATVMVIYSKAVAMAAQV
jgi:hypothetical protein